MARGPNYPRKRPVTVVGRKTIHGIKAVRKRQPLAGKRITRARAAAQLLSAAVEQRSRSQEAAHPYILPDKSIPARISRKDKDYHVIKINLSAAQKNKLKKLQNIRLHKGAIEGARRGIGESHLYVTKRQLNKINSKKSRGIQFALSPHQLHFNRLHGSGIFSSFKDLVRSGYNKLKDSGLAEKAASAAGNYALQQGKKVALNKLEGKQGAVAGAARNLLGGSLRDLIVPFVPDYGGKGLPLGFWNSGNDGFGVGKKRKMKGGKMEGDGLLDFLGGVGGIF